MGKTARIVAGSGIALLAIVLVAVFLLVRNLDAIVASAIEDVGSRVTGTAVRVSGVDIRLREARGEIDTLTVANPEGFATGEALRVGQVALALDAGSIGKDVVRIRKLGVDGASLTAELTMDGRINLKLLQDRLGAGGDEPAGVGPATRLIIERFAFTHAELKLVMPTGKEYRTDLAPVHLQGIGERAGGVTAAEAARQLLAPVLDAAVQAARREAAQRGAEDLKQKATDKLKEKLGVGGG